MTMDEAKKVQKMEPEELVHCDLVDSALLPNLRDQRDNAIAECGKWLGERAGVQKQNADALAAKAAEHQAAMQAKDAEHADAVAKIQEEHKATLMDLQKTMAERDAVTAGVQADHQAVVTDLQAKLTAMQAYVDACGGTEMAQKLRREQLIAAETKKLEQAKAALSALEGE